MNLPVLYKKTSTGKIQTWQIDVRVVDNINGNVLLPVHAEIITVYGQQDGKLQTTSDIISEGKNIGRSNETTPLEQAEFESRAQWQKKKDKGYVENKERAEAKETDNEGGIDPMLAHVYNKQKDKIKWPAYVQPKLNGHRCIAVINGGICTLWSRTRKSITGVPHIAKSLVELYPTASLILDGELYVHELGSEFEKLTSFIRQEMPKEGHEQIQYHIYDRVTSQPFYERILENTLEIPDDHLYIKIVETVTCENEESMLKCFSDYLALGYEGVMVRNINSLYVNKRTTDLLKVKEMNDADYLIIGVKEGRGRMTGKAVFICDAPESTPPDGDTTFDVKMKGNLNNLIQYIDNPKLAIGKKLVVQFQTLSVYGFPIFPVGLRLKDPIEG